MSPLNELANNLYHNYESYKERRLNNRRIKHSDILPLLNELKDKNIFTLNKLGESHQGREIFLIKAGHGEKKIFLWSQMHGDESTATMAIFDFFNFLSSTDHFNDFKKDLLSNITLYFIPMLNPDGAEIFQRRNSLEIDINRDALKTKSIEARILKNTFEQIKPDFGFNLHDQDSYYSPGKSFKSASISLLAPPVDDRNSKSKSRKKAMKLISELYVILHNFIPGHIAKYSDEFEPRAFGDNFQKWGMSTILIESGFWKDDTEKQFLRKLNFITYICAFASIAFASYENFDENIYESIPLNKENLLDLILRNVNINFGNSKVQIDIGILLEEINIPETNSCYIKSKIAEIGDLSTNFGFEEFDCSVFEAEVGKTFYDEFVNYYDLEEVNFKDLYSQGFTNVILTSEFEDAFLDLPINIFKSKEKAKEKLKIDCCANLVLKKNNEVKYVILNGFLFDLNDDLSKIKNGIVIQ